jgi:POT family proton-dependent oligopeptide transporter
VGAEALNLFERENHGMARERHPAGLKILFMTEMWERFGFYLMLGIFPLYMTDKEKGGMGWSSSDMAVIFGSYLALVYFTPFIGGLLADRVLGSRKTILIGATLMMLGYFALAIPGEVALYVALGIIILGNGAFKPNISSLLGNLYPPGSKLKDAGFSIFYLGINIGAFFCNFVAAMVRNYFDENPLYLTEEWRLTGWAAAFATAGFGMFIGLTFFALNYGRFAEADPDRRAAAGSQESLMPLWVQCLGPALALGIAGWFLPELYKQFTDDEFPLNPPTSAFVLACLPVLLFYYNIWRNVPDEADRGRVAALLVIFGVVIVFWMTFHLNGTALNIWTRDDTDRIPNALVRPVTDSMEAFAENADTRYYENAGPDVPRPNPKTLKEVDQKQYDKLKKENKLWEPRGDKLYLYVTPEIKKKIYANTNSDTPILPEGKHLKLANTELFQSINPGYVILLTPVVLGFFAALRRRGKEPSTSAKIGLGLLLTAGGPLLMLTATLVSNDGAVKVSSWWLFGTYAIVTFGELCLSPMGLALVNKMSPHKIQAFMMGGWFLSTSLGSKMSGIFGEAYEEWDHRVFWIVLMICNVFFAAVIFCLLPWLNRQMGAAKTTEVVPAFPETEVDEPDNRWER